MTAVDNGVDIWSDVRERLVRYALSLGVSSHDAQDCAHEAIGRALAREVPYTDADDLLRWCQRVTHNLVMDEHRHRRRWWLGAFESPVPSQPATADVADGVADRDLLQRTLTAVQQLPRTQREAIVNVLDSAHGAVGAKASRQEQVRAAVARNRARSALRDLVGYGAAVAAVMIRLGRRRLRAVAPAGALATAAFLLTPLALPAAVTASPSDDATRVSVVRPPQQVSVRNARPTRPARQHVSGARRESVTAPIVRIHRAGLVASVETRPASPERDLVCLQAPALPELCVR